MSYETSARVEAFRHLSDAVFADGVVEPWENQVLNRAAGFLGLSSGQLQAVAQESMRRFKAGELGEAGPMNRLGAYQGVLRFVMTAGGLGTESAAILRGLRQLLQVQLEDHLRLLREVLETEGLQPKNVAGQGLSDELFVELCAAGTRTNGAILGSDSALAAEQLLEIMARQLAAGSIDPFLFAKCALNLMLSHVFRKDHVGAHAIWIAPEQSLLWYGVSSLEAGHTSVNDLILSFQISAYLHSLTPDPERALLGVKEFTRRILKYCKEERPDWIGQALGNWRWHLDEVFERDVPAGHLREIQAEAIACGVEVAPRGGLFFEPSDWVIDW